jgi:hypothetical protein
LPQLRFAPEPDGYEAVHMMRKGQVRWLPGHDVKRQLQFVDKLFGLAA